MSEPLGNKLTQLISVLLRLLFASAVASPIVLFVLSALVGINKEWLNPLDHLDSVAVWLVVLWVASVVVGFPAATIIVNSVSSTAGRFGYLVLVGTVVAAFLSLPAAGLGFPAGTITAAACFIFNYNLLKQESFIFMGKAYGPHRGV